MWPKLLGKTVGCGLRSTRRERERVKLTDWAGLVSLDPFSADSSRKAQVEHLKANPRLWWSTAGVPIEGNWALLYAVA